MLKELKIKHNNLNKIFKELAQGYIKKGYSFEALKELLSLTKSSNPLQVHKLNS